MRLIIFLSIFSLALVNSNTQAKQQNVRFYKVNKQLQATRIFFTQKKGQQSGCHNFLKRVRVHRFNQYGYQHCSVYTKKNCAADSILTATRKKDKTPTTILTQGFSWFPTSENIRGAKLKSWYCE